MKMPSLIHPVRKSTVVRAARSPPTENNVRRSQALPALARRKAIAQTLRRTPSHIHPVRKSTVVLAATPPTENDVRRSEALAVLARRRATEQLPTKKRSLIHPVRKSTVALAAHPSLTKIDDPAQVRHSKAPAFLARRKATVQPLRRSSSIIHPARWSTNITTAHPPAVKRKAVPSNATMKKPAKEGHGQEYCVRDAPATWSAFCVTVVYSQTVSRTRRSVEPVLCVKVQCEETKQKRL